MKNNNGCIVVVVIGGVFNAYGVAGLGGLHRWKSSVVLGLNNLRQNPKKGLVIFDVTFVLVVYTKSHC